MKQVKVLFFVLVLAMGLCACNERSANAPSFFEVGKLYECTFGLDIVSERIRILEKDGNWMKVKILTENGSPEYHGADILVNSLGYRLCAELKSDK